MKKIPEAWMDGARCAECGKEFCVLYPQLWRYKNGKRFFCSWHCLRANESKGETETMAERIKKNGEPAKKPGRKPQAKPEAKVTLADAMDGMKQAADDFFDQVGLPGVAHEFAEDGVHLKKVTKPVSYDGFDVAAIKGDFGRYGRDTFNGTEYLDFETNDGDEISMPVDAWKDFLQEVVRAAAILGVEL